MEENNPASPLIIESRGLPKPLLVIAGILLLGLLMLVPIGRSKPPRNGPFHPDFQKTYRVEPMRGYNWLGRIHSVEDDSLNMWNSDGKKLPLEDIARISVDGRTYYLNPEAEPNEDEMFATEQMKWAGEGRERWNVGGLIGLLIAAAFGFLH